MQDGLGKLKRSQRKSRTRILFSNVFLFVLLIKQQAARFSNGNDAFVSCVDGRGF